MRTALRRLDRDGGRGVCSSVWSVTSAPEETAKMYSAWVAATRVEVSEVSVASTADVKAGL